MNKADRTELQTGLARFAHFRSDGCDDRVFTHPTGHPSQPTGFCVCDGPWHRAVWFYLKAGVAGLILKLPFNAPKTSLLRRLGAKIGRNVYVSAGVWIDPLFPELLTIEDDVLVGIDVRLVFHEFRQDEFRAGRIVIRRGAVIGGFAIIGPGVEVGERAVVAGAAVVGHDVPPGAVAAGNPARIVRRSRPGAENHDD